MRINRISPLVAVVALAGPLLAPGVSAADEARPEQAKPAAGVGSDVVLLKDGGMVRGTISEMDPKRVVVITLASGETRRIPMAQVNYAGPAANMPSAGGEGFAGTGSGSGARPMVTLHAREARLKLRAVEPGLTYYVRTGSAWSRAVGTHGSAVGLSHSYDQVCTAPCEATVPAGTYTMAISSGTGAPVEVEDPVHIPGPSDLEAKYQSYIGMRVAGLIVGVASLGVGLYLMITGLLETRDECVGAICTEERDPDTTKIIVGISVLVGGGIIGSVLASKSDEAEIFVIPASAGGLPMRNSVAGLDPVADDGSVWNRWKVVPGLSLGGTF